MDDLISRQTAIDALMEIMDRPNHADFLYTDEICKTLNELPSTQPEPKWIPVMERLPEIKQRVLITYNTEDGLKTDVTWYDKYGFMLSGDVTAWMPMVEPYKEESGE